MRKVACVLVAWGCGRAAAPPEASTCLADTLGELRDVSRLETTCREQRNCRASCERGDAVACMHHAYDLQDSKRAVEADEVFARACKLGLAIGCTNYGASVWLARPGTQECARRLFERACAVNEPLGCGMTGRMLAATARTPAQKEAARQYFDRICSEIGSMTCRMYAFHVERGDLGPFEPATVKALMIRACDTGDVDACGRDTASETFH